MEHRRGIETVEGVAAPKVSAEPTNIGEIDVASDKPRYSRDSTAHHSLFPLSDTSTEVLGPKDVLILVSPHPFSGEHAAQMMAEFERVGLRNRVLIMDRQNLEVLVARVEKEEGGRE